MVTQGKPKVYLESSTISYLTARPTEEPIRKAKQILTRRWWERRESFELYISETVIAEIIDGDRQAAELRLQAIEGIPILPLDEKVERLAQTLLALGAVPEPLEADAQHIAFASIFGFDFLITWNQKHIATEKKKRQIEAIIEGFALKPPKLFTPEQHLIFEET
jgi:predicted nucleic acid-binding protein